MDEEVLQAIRQEIKDTIKVVVNGKIDHLTELMNTHNEKHEKDMVEVREHIKEVKPYLDSARGVKTLGELGKWIATLVTAGGILWMFVKSFTR